MSRRVERPSLRFGMGLEALLKVWKGSGGHPSGPGGVRRPSQRSRRGWEAILEFRVARPEVRRGWRAIPVVREECGGPLGGPRGIGRPSRRSVRGREALWEVRVGLGGPLRCPGEVDRPAQRS